MFSVSSFSYLGLLNTILGFVTLYLLVRSKTLRVYWPLLVIALWQVLPFVTLNLLREYRVFSAQHAYALYFYVYWSSFAIAAISSGILSFTIFEESLRPLKGLLSLGRVMFRWITGITLAVTLSVALQPSSNPISQIVNSMAQLQRITGIVALCLLMFVIVTVKPLGLTFRSRIFGVGLGMGVVMGTSIYTAGYMALAGSMYNNYSLLLISAECISQMIWIWYFAVPEPTRKFLLLPTTSPFHQWNLVSERMGYDPGYVAIGGVPPASFSEAERTIFERIAAQDNGRAERLNEISSETLTLEGSSAQTVAATEHFNRVWEFRYQTTREPLKNPKPSEG